MKRYGMYFLYALSAGIIFLSGCSRFSGGGQLDACKLVTQSDAEKILMNARFDKEATAEAARLSGEPEVRGACIYTSGNQSTSPRLVVGYRLYDEPGIVIAGFQDAKETTWKDETMETVAGGDEAILVGGRMIVLRKGKTWLQIGVMQVQPGEFSVDELKNAAKKAGASL